MLPPRIGSGAINQVIATSPKISVTHHDYRANTEVQIMPDTSNMSQEELDLWSDINNPNNDADMDDWADAHNPNNEDYIDE